MALQAGGSVKNSVWCNGQPNASLFSVIITRYSEERRSSSMIGVGFSRGQWPRSKFFKPSSLYWAPCSCAPCSGSWLDSQLQETLQKPQEFILRGLELVGEGEGSILLIILLLSVFCYTWPSCVSLSLSLTLAPSGGQWGQRGVETVTRVTYFYSRCYFIASLKRKSP